MDKIILIIKTTIVQFYRLVFSKKVDNNRWIFSSSFNTEYNYNSKYLFEYIYNNKRDIEAYYVINDYKKKDEIAKKYNIDESRIINTKSFSGINKALSSGVWLTSAGLPVYGFKLSNKILIINLWHGVPLKKIALLSNETSKISKLFFKYLFSNNYSYILTTSNNLSNIMARSFGVSIEKIKVWGQPRNDCLFQRNDKQKILNNLYEDLPLFNKVILYAPTYRETIGTKLFPFEDMDFKKLDKFLNENNLIIFVRVHQSEINKQTHIISDRVRFINQDIQEDINEILNIFDLLITDYSSIYIDYLMLNKPILFLPYDKVEYIDSRGFNFDYDKITPGPKPDTFLNFLLEIDKSLSDIEYYLNERIKINSFMNDKNYTVSEKIYTSIKSLIDERYKLLD